MMRFAAVFVCLLAAGAAQAKPVVYDCVTTAGAAGGGYIQPQIVLSHDTATGQVMVYDAIVQQLNGKPLAARIVEENDKRLTVAWRMLIKDVTGNPTQMDYRAVYLKGPKSFLVSARPSGYDNLFEGRGTCTVK